MLIFDKASWQIDNGMPVKDVIKHFELIMKFLFDNSLFNDAGMELYELGVDQSISINENILNSKGVEFMKNNYDKMISENGYDTVKNKAYLDLIKF